MLAVPRVPCLAQQHCAKPWTPSSAWKPLLRLLSRTNPPMADRTILTKYGRITGQQWIRQRFYEQFDDWLTPQALHYIFTRTPAAAEDGTPIVHPSFERLVFVNPAAANNHLIGEANAFFDELPQRDQRRITRAAQKAAANKAAVKAHTTKRKHKPNTPLIPGI